MGQINTNNYPTVNSLLDADLLIVENATNGTGTTTPKQLRENAIGTATLQTSAQTVTGAINELKHEIDLGAGVARYDVDTITSGYLGQFSGSANLLLLHLTTDGTADATNGYMMMLSYSRPVARFAYGRLVDADGVAYKQDVYADNTIICKISNSGEGTESDPVRVVILGIINAGFMLTPTAVISDRDIIDGQGNTLSVLAEALTKTASGNPVVITDCAGGKARSLKTVINAIQDLHGYDHPWVGGADINYLDLKARFPDNAKSVTSDGITYTRVDDTDGNPLGVQASNTATGYSYCDVQLTLEAGRYKSAVTGIEANKMSLNLRKGTNREYFKAANEEFTLTEQTLIWVRFTVNQGDSANNTIKCMIYKYDGTDKAFRPYSNICPISGRDSVVVDDTGVNLTEDKISGCNLMSNGGIITDATFDMQIAKVKQGETYVITTDDTSGAVYGFFTSKPVQGSTSYNGTRYVTAVKTFTAPITGYVAYRTFANFATPQCEIGSTPTPYEPYAHSSATIQLGQTVYGANIDWDTGVMTVKTAKVDMGSLTYTAQGRSDDGIGYLYSAFPTGALANGECISSIFAYTSYVTVAARWEALTTGHLSIIGNGRLMVCGTETTPEAFKTAVTGQDLEYKLATPTTIQLTPEQLELLKGYNRVSIESGSIEVGYIAKIS